MIELALVLMFVLALIKIVLIPYNRKYRQVHWFMDFLLLIVLIVGVLGIIWEAYN